MFSFFGVQTILELVALSFDGSDSLGNCEFLLGLGASNLRFELSNSLGSLRLEFGKFFRVLDFELGDFLIGLRFRLDDFGILVGNSALELRPLVC